MKSKRALDLVLEDFKGKEFVYKTKYGGVVEGTIAGFSLCAEATYIGKFKDQVRVYQHKLSVISKNGNVYDFNDVYLKEW
ncbi:MAG: hypothetical protein WD512_14220 [Candidatus Paceibacterota bacterium]